MIADMAVFFVMKAVDWLEFYVMADMAVLFFTEVVSWLEFNVMADLTMFLFHGGSWLVGV